MTIHSKPLMRLVRVLICALCLAFTISLNAQNRLVSPGGNDIGNCVGTPCATISYAIGQAVAGDVIEVANGSYTVSSTINVNREVTISGESEAGVILDASGLMPLSTRVIETDADNVTLESFTIKPITDPDPNSGNGIGFTVKAGSNSAPAINNNVTLRNITIDGAAERTPFDFHGIDGLTIENLSASGTTRGNGINITGCTDVNINGFTGTNNAWGSIAIYASRDVPAGGRGSDDVTIVGSALAIDGAVYSQNDLNGVNDLFNTSITVVGWDYTVANDDFRGDGEEFTFFSEDGNSALTLATSLNAENGGNSASVIQQVSTGNWLVGSGLTIQAAIDAASDGDLIEVAAGTFSEEVTINRPLTLHGAGCVNTIIDGGGTNATGITVPANTVDVSISNLSIINTNGGSNDAGIRVFAGCDGLSIDDVCISNTPGRGGIYVDGDVDGVDITNSEVTGPATNGRGIVVWNGFKQNINISNNYVHDIGGCCGIELQDGTASGVTMSGNTVENVGDSGMSAVGLTSGAGPNVISGNIITDNGRFGFEMKNPDGTGLDSGDGSIVIENNTISLTTAISDQRDLAGIAVMRRGVQAANVDVPTGVIVRNNTISGYQQSSDSDGFGIVLGGTNHTVENNDLTNNDVGIQQQAGHAPYPGDGNQNNIADDYFGRDNSPATCSNTVIGNTFSGNGEDERNVGVSSGSVTNTNTGETFCSIQTAIDDADTEDGHVIEVSAGMYPEYLQVTKELDIRGPNYGINPNTGTRVAEAIITPDVSTNLGNPEGDFTAVISVSAENVSIDGLRVSGDNGLPTTNYVGLNIQAGIGIYSIADGLTISNNIVDRFSVISIWSARSSTNVNNDGAIINVNVSNNLIQESHDIRPSGFGFGIYIQGTDGMVMNNVAERVRNGIQVQPYGAAGGGIVSNNQFDAYNLGIWYNFASPGSGTWTIENNNILGVTPPATISGGGGLIWSGIAVQTMQLNAGPAIFQGNFIDGGVLSSSTSDYDEIIGYRVRTPNSNATDINSFTNNSIVNVETSINNQTAEEVNANCNWYGTSVFSDIESAITGVVDFVPYLNDGTDDDLGTAGFQPVPGSCVDGPVRVYSDAALTTFVNGYTTIQAAINDATTMAGYFVQVDAGTYVEAGQIIIDKDLTIIGAGKTLTTIMTDQNTGTGGDARGWWLVNTGVNLDLSDVKLDGSGFLIFQAIRQKGSGSIDNVHFTEIKYNESGPNYQGVAVAAFGDGNVDVTNSLFDNIGRIGVLYFGTGINGSNYSNNSYTGKGIGDFLDYALDISAGAIVNATGSTIQGNKGTASSDGSKSAGILVSTFFALGTEATITGNTVTDNTCGITVGFNSADESTVVISSNDIFSNTLFGVNSTNSIVDATENWWGDASGPSGVGPGTGDEISVNVVFCPWLDASITVPGQATSGPGNGLATNTTTGESFCSIQDAIDDADTQNGDVIVVATGTYDESIVVNKSLTINGPNVDVACGSRGAEAIVSPASGVPFTVTADDVTINGFEITAPASTNGVNFGNTSNVSIKFNNIHDIGTTVTNANVHAIIYTVASGASTSGASITDNCFESISSPLLSGFSASAIGILQSTSTGVLDGLNIERNTINDVEVNTGDWPTGKIAYGIQINVGGGSGYLTTAGEVLNAVIRNNEISNLSGFISTGIGLEGNTKDVVVENNVVSNLFGRKFSGNRAGGAYDLSALKFENNRWVSTVIVQNNSFRVNTFTHDATAGLGYAVSNYVPVGSAFTEGGGGTTGEATISCNWLGTDVNGEIADNASFTGTIFNKDNCVTNFVPFLVNDTDDAPGVVGFQPAPLSCIGGPVQVFDGNTFIAVYTEIQAAIDDATTLSGHTVRIASGTYDENVDAVTIGKDLIFAPGASPGCVIINGDFTLNAGDALEIEIEGTTPCTDHDQFVVTGTVDLGGATLTTPQGMYLAEAGDEIVIIDGSSSVVGTFDEGNFVTDGINTYYISYVAGTDGFDVVLTKCCDGLLDLGLANYAETSPVGNKLQVFLRPNMDVVNGAYSAGVFTIRTLTSNAVTFTKLGGALSPFEYTQVGTATDGAFTYYFFSYETFNFVDWTAGTEYLLLTLSYDCIADAEFELTNDAFTMTNNGDYYQELGGAEAQGIFYLPTAVSPTAVSITADNSGTVCDGVDIDLSSVTLDGTAPYTYLWSGPDMYSSTEADPVPFASSLASNGMYTVTVTDANGCTATATTEVVVLDNAACVHNVTQDNYYPTITEAVDAAETVDDDILFVPAANWPENVVVTKALTITGANAGIPCDDAGRTAESTILGTTVITIASNGVTIDGFTIEGITGIASAGFVDVSLVNNNINAKEFGINTSLVTTSAADGYTIQDNCIVFSDQVFDVQGFATNPTIADAQAPATWYTDRFAPAEFVAEVFGGDSRLKHSIDAADCQSCRPANLSSAFYNTQGRKYDITGTTAMSIELYVPSDWATTGRRMAGFWGTAINAGSSISGFPIIEFTSSDGAPRFRGWNSGTWVDLGLPTGFVYDAWYTLEIAILPNDEFMYSVGDVSASVPASGSIAIDNVILQGHNTDTPGVTYDIYWDNFNTFCAPVAENSQTIGVNLAVADGPEAVVLQDNNISNSFYGYLLGGVTTTSRTTVQGGEFTDIMQGVVVANIVNSVSFLPSSIGVSDLSMTSFSGDYPALPAFNFHSGVYAFTGGSDVAAIVDLMIDNVTISNTGKPAQNSAGLHFADFSIGTDARLVATVTNSVISDNLNRGVQIRGGNASATVSDSDILGNGSDPFGAGGNNGFGVIANNGSQIELYNNNIVNPASQAGFFPVTAIFNGVAPASTIIANNNFIDDSGNGDVTSNSFDISFFDATCNWWGSDDVDVIDVLVEGNVLFLPYLDDGTDDQPGTVGFQTSANCINPTAWYVNDKSQTDDLFTLAIGSDANQGTRRRPFRTIGKAVMTVENNTSTGPDDNSIFVDAGDYDEQVVVPNTVGGLTLQGVGPCDAVAPGLTTMVDFTGTTAPSPTKPALFDISGADATVDGFQFRVDLSKLSSAVIASDINLNTIAITNNCIDPYRSVPGSSFTSYGERNAVSVNHGVHRVNTSNPEFTFTGNTVNYNFNGTPTDPSDDDGFRAGLASDEGVGFASGNVIQTISHDIELRFSGPGDILMSDNEFNGGGVNLAEYNSNTGTVTVSENDFNGLFGSTFTSALRMRNNQVNRVSLVENNTFLDHTWGISLENYPAITVDGNDFTPLAGATDFRHITVNTKSISTNSAAIPQVEINGTFTGNTFNSNGDDTGTAMAFYNHDSDDADLGFFTVGTAGSPNTFAQDFLYAVYLGDQTDLTTDAAALAEFPEYDLDVAMSTTQMACWDRDIDVQNNTFDIGAGAQLPATMDNAERMALEDILYHLPDNACLGELIYFDPVLVDAKVFLQGPYDSVTGLMKDDLRSGGLLPSSEPFSTINGAHPGSFDEVNNFVTETVTAPVLAVTGNDAIVDWVWLELRDMSDFNNVVATRSALVQRDGDIVDLDGVSGVEFPDTYVGQYYLLVRHRNHLGAMTANPVDFTAVMPVDFTVAAEPTFGATTTSARRLVKTGIYGLWAGNTLPFPSAGFNVKYNGSDNDRLSILNAIGNSTPLNILSGVYRLEDVNMDGRVKYNGSGNDRVIILQNVGPSSPLNVITQEPNN